VGCAEEGEVRGPNRKDNRGRRQGESNCPMGESSRRVLQSKKKKSQRGGETDSPDMGRGEASRIDAGKGDRGGENRPNWTREKKRRG